jgi:hypothetical protein
MTEVRAHAKCCSVLAATFRPVRSPVSSRAARSCGYCSRYRKLAEGHVEARTGGPVSCLLECGAPTGDEHERVVDRRRAEPVTAERPARRGLEPPDLPTRCSGCGAPRRLWRLSWRPPESTSKRYQASAAV